MAFTQSDIDALDRAIATGYLAVTHSDGRHVTYRSVEELRQAKAEAQKEVASAAGTKLRRTVVRTVKGW
jgi:hypothetical protein